MTLHSFAKYIQYRLRAKTRHGIHSPFVYHFIDNCLRTSSKLTLRQRIDNYFGNNVTWVEDWKDATHFPIPEDTIIAFQNIHITKQQSDDWQLLSAMDSYNITIDLFSIGLLIYKPSIKEKQHFVLQYPL